MEEKIAVIRLELDVDKYTAEAVELNKKIKDLKTEQKNLQKAGKETSLEYQKNAEQLKTYQRELANTNKTIQDSTRANKASAGSNEQLRAQLSVMTAEYNKLSAEERENTTRGRELGQTVALLTSNLKANESAVGDNRRNVGNYSGALAELKAELKEARGALIAIGDQFGENSKEFQEAKIRAAELNDKLQDIQETIKASTGEPLERLAGDVDLLKDKVLTLDFKGIGQQLSSLGETVRGINFKSLTQGSEGLTAGLGKLATAILKNPLFIMAGVITAVVLALKEYSEIQEQRAIAATERTTEAIARQVEYYGDLVEATKANSDIQIRLLQSQGGKEEEVFKKRREALDDDFRRRAEAHQGYVDAITRLEREANNAQDEESLKKVQEEIRRVEDLKEQNKKVLKNYNEEVQILENEHTKFEKEENKKRADDYKKRMEERRADNEKLLRQIEDQEIEAVQDEELRNFAKAAIENKRAVEEINKSKADDSVKKAALAEQQKTFERQLTEINKKGIADRAAAENEADVRKKEIDLQATLLDKQSVESELQRRRILSDEKIKIVQQASGIELQILQKELDLKKQILDAEILALQAKQQAGTATSAELLELQNLNAQKLVLDEEYSQKRVETERRAQANIDQVRKDALEQKLADMERDVEIAKIMLSSLNDLLYIFGANQNEMTEFAKGLALFQIALDTAKAISGVVAMSTEGDPYTYALRVATGIATVIANVAKAKELITGKPRQANIQQFAEGGKPTLSGTRISSSHGTSRLYSSGDSIIAAVKPGEVILNERQQSLLGGANTFRSIGVPGFADGGITGAFVSQSAENQLQVSRQVELAMQNMPPIVVAVQDIIDGLDTNAKITTNSEV